MTLPQRLAACQPEPQKVAHQLAVSLRLAGVTVT